MVGCCPGEDAGSCARPHDVPSRSLRRLRAARGADLLDTDFLLDRCEGWSEVAEVREGCAVDALARPVRVAPAAARARWRHPGTHARKATVSTLVTLNTTSCSASACGTNRATRVPERRGRRRQGIRSRTRSWIRS